MIIFQHIFGDVCGIHLNRNRRWWLGDLGKSSFRPPLVATLQILRETSARTVCSMLPALARPLML